MRTRIRVLLCFVALSASGTALARHAFAYPQTARRQILPRGRKNGSAGGTGGAQAKTMPAPAEPRTAY